MASHNPGLDFVNGYHNHGLDRSEDIPGYRYMDIHINGLDIKRIRI